MSKSLKITWDEVIKLLEEHYKIKNIRMMTDGGYDPDYEICQTVIYIEGEIDDM